MEYPEIPFRHTPIQPLKTECIAQDCILQTWEEMKVHTVRETTLFDGRMFLELTKAHMEWQLIPLDSDTWFTVNEDMKDSLRILSRKVNVFRQYHVDNAVLRTRRDSAASGLMMELYIIPKSLDHPPFSVRVDDRGVKFRVLPKKE